MKKMQAEPARPAVPTDNTALRDWIRALEDTAPIAAHPQRLRYHVIADLADTQGDAPALIAADGGEILTYRGLIARANRSARWAIGQRLGMMPNRPDYLAIWLGLSSIGIVVALINTELRGHSLAHCIDIVTPKHLIIAAEYGAQLQGAAAQLVSGPKVWAHGECDGGRRFAARGLRSERHRRHALLRRSSELDFRAARPGALRAHQNGRGAGVAN
jgi:fatty-acyl-CoA synthase